MTACGLIFACACVAQTPAPDLPQDKQDREKPTPAPIERGASTAFLDFGHPTIGARVTRVAFSSDFEVTRVAGGGIFAHFDSPWLSRKVFGKETDAFGLFAGFTACSIDRNLAVNEPSGTPLFADFGLDFAVINNDNWVATIQAGVEYGYFGGEIGRAHV